MSTNLVVDTSIQLRSPDFKVTSADAYTTRYKQLQPEDRVTLAALHQQGGSRRQIAAVLGRSPATVSRELRRNSRDVGDSSSAAQRLSTQRRVASRPASRLDPAGPLWPLVTHMLGWLWSPQKIARTLRSMWPENPELPVSHETIYNAIYAYPKGELRKLMARAR
jgi:transposase, IS30 family